MATMNGCGFINRAQITRFRVSPLLYSLVLRVSHVLRAAGLIPGTMTTIRPRLNDDKRRPRSWPLQLLLLFLAFYLDLTQNQRPLLLVAPVVQAQAQHHPGDSSHSQHADGPLYIVQGDELFAQRAYDDAAMLFWKAVLLHGQTPPDKTYNVQDVFTKFMQCYILQDRMADGLAHVSVESFRRGQNDMGRSYLQNALQVDPRNAAALQIQREFKHLLGNVQNQDTSEQQDSSASTMENTVLDEQDDDELYGKTPEQLYEIASAHFAKKEYEDCADIFEISCMRSGYQLYPSCANAVYCRNTILDWGFNGTQFDRDMQRTVQLVQQETRLYRINHTSTTSATRISSSNADRNNNFAWQRATSVHPHMMLGYPLADSMLKRYVAESVAYMDELMARAGQQQSSENNKDHAGQSIIPPLPADMPFSIDPAPFVAEKEAAMNDNDGDSYRIRVGFVGSGFNSKAVLYLSQDMFRFFDKTRFEIHVFSFGPPDSPLFIQHGMRGVDWRERVKSNMYRFHDMNEMKLQDQHIAAARYIHGQGIHILIEWDGYARQGERAQGLFALRPAPIQMLHQEYLGTSGAVYVDYLFTDQVSSPPHLQHLYTEKLVYLPNHFFSKGHAMQTDDVYAPSHDYRPKAHRNAKYELGRGSPAENRCLAPPDVGPATASFVFCNWNKLLKANPETVRSWIRILRQVPDSTLCLLENPKTGTAYLRKFVHEAAGTSRSPSGSSSNSKDNNGNNDGWENFVPGDGDELNSRIHFLPWQRNPFDHQRRNTDFCNVMLDSYPYNGHTVAQDALYAGVPIITRSDGQDMCSRVTTSANIVLFGQDNVLLNAYNGTRHYEELAIAMATNQTLYQTTRRRLIDSCLQRNPMHPYWDVPRYVKNFETGLTMAWERFLQGHAPDHIVVVESETAATGTFNDEILAHPIMGNYNKDDKRKGKVVAKEQRRQQHQGSDEL